MSSAMRGGRGGRRSAARREGASRAVRKELGLLPIRGTAPADPPQIASNPRRSQVVEIKISGPDVTIDNKAVRTAIVAANGLGTVKLAFAVLKVSVWGPRLAGGRVTVSDFGSGIAFTDQSSLGSRTRVALRYPRNIAPIAPASQTEDAGLVTCVVEGASEGDYGLCHVSLEWWIHP